LIVEREYSGRKFYPIYFRLLDEGGKVLMSSEGVTGEIVPVDLDLLKRVRLDGTGEPRSIKPFSEKEHFRMYTHPIISGEKLTHYIQLGTSLKFYDRTVEKFRENILAAIPLALLIGALVGWLLARGSLRTIQDIIGKTRTITARNLRERLTPRGSGDELDELIKTINDMISRIEEGFQRITQFSADASHELRTPICSMRGEAEVALSKERSPDEYRRILSQYVERFDHLTHLINELLLLSKSDLNREELTWTSINLKELLANLHEFFGVLAEQRGVEFALDGMEDVTIQGDKGKLQQLFTNLIDNAIRYTPSSGRVTVSLRSRRDEAVVSVSDTGMGIDERDLPHIFERFYRVDKSRSKEIGGSGLGLSICQWIVQAHRGEIKVYSKPREGSTFTVHLPKIPSSRPSG
jgi:heavy metal sensor kinase